MKPQSVIMRHKLSTTMSIAIFDYFRYPNNSSARIGKQKILSHMKNNHFDTQKAAVRVKTPPKVRTIMQNDSL